MALSAGVLAPALVVVVVRAGRAWLPVQDFAVIDLRVRDVWSWDVPLVGPYSRFGWNHPGPWIYWVTAPLSLLAGRAAWATLVGFALIQVVAIVWLAVSCWRHGKLFMTAFGLAVVGGFYATVGPQIVLDPWNPNVAVPFFVLFVFQLWFLACGDRRQLPALVVVATLIVQAHVGYVPLVLAGSVTAALFVARDTRAGSIALARWRRSAAWALGWALLLWLPPLIEEVRRAPRGSMALTVGYFTTGARAPADSAAGIHAALGIFGRAFTILPPWLGGVNAVDEFTGAIVPVSLWWWLVPLGIGGTAALAVAHTKNRGDRRLLIVTMVLIAVGVLAIGGARGELRAYMFFWSVPTALLFLGAAGRSMLRWAGLLSQPNVRAATVVVLALAALAPSVALAHVVLDAAKGSDARSERAAALLDILVPYPPDDRARRGQRHRRRRGRGDRRTRPTRCAGPRR